MSTQDSASDFRNIEKALRLLRAYEANPAVKVQDNPVEVLAAAHLRLGH